MTSSSPTINNQNRRAQAIIPAGQLSSVLLESLRKLNPIYVARNPVMFVVEMGTLITAYLTLANIVTGKPWVYALVITLLLALTVAFATFAEAVAEARGKAQASSLRAARADTPSRLIETVNGVEIE